MRPRFIGLLSVFMAYPITGVEYIDVVIEREKSIRKHGEHAQDNLKVGDPNLLYNLGEEFGEVCHALTYDSNDTNDKLRKELIQVAAMALAWVNVIDKERGI